MKNNLRTPAVIDAFKKRTHAIHPEDKYNLLETEDYYYASQIIDIEQSVREIIKSNNIFFSIGKNESNILTVACKNPHFLDVINRCITSNLAQLIAFGFPIHKFNPHIDLFIKNANDKLGSDLGIYLGRNVRDAGWPYHNNAYDKYDELVMTVDMLNEFVDRIRREAETPKFKKKIANYRSNIIEQNRGMVHYINYLFDKYSSLLVLRVDFGYIKDRPMDINGIKEQYKQARSDRENFMDDKINSMFEHRVGFAWKLEYCSMKGFYYQMFFFFDGSEVQLDSNGVMNFGENIGEYWKTTITQGKGLYFNYYDPKSKNSRYPWIGMINRDDYDRRGGLEKAVGDLIKPDYYAKIDTFGKDKAFAKGEILKPKTN